MSDKENVSDRIAKLRAETPYSGLSRKITTIKDLSEHLVAWTDHIWEVEIDGDESDFEFEFDLLAKILHALEWNDEIKKHYSDSTIAKVFAELYVSLQSRLDAIGNNLIDPENKTASSMDQVLIAVKFIQFRFGVTPKKIPFLYGKKQELFDALEKAGKQGLTFGEILDLGLVTGKPESVGRAISRLNKTLESIDSPNQISVSQKERRRDKSTIPAVLINSEKI
jgi:hypothetical protein